MEKVVIDNTYIMDISEYFEMQGKQLQGLADRYMNIMNRVVEEGISGGETSDSIRQFLTYAEQLKHVISDTSTEISDSVMNFLEEVNEQERYSY